MAFRDFTYPEAMTTFGLIAQPPADLFAAAPPVAPPPALTETLAVSARLAAIVGTEKVRNEGMIAPVLFAFWGRYEARVGLYSGNQFDADPDDGLTGYCDFLLSRSPQQPVITAPAVVIFEAKKDNINDGLGQCVAGMVGARRFNRRHNAPVDPLYGCVTTGSAWRFLRLAGNGLTIDLPEYNLSQVDKLLGIFTHIIGPVPVPAAA